MSHLDYHGRASSHLFAIRVRFIPHSLLLVGSSPSPTMALPRGIPVDPLFQVLSIVRIARKAFPFIVLFVGLASTF